MEEKVRYQYSYFIYPFVIKNYENYIYSLLKNKKIKLDLFEKEKDIELYTYFHVNIKEYFFESMTWNNEKRKTFLSMEDGEKKKKIVVVFCFH